MYDGTEEEEEAVHLRVATLIGLFGCIYMDPEERERTILHHVPSPTGLTRWNIQRIPNMFIEVACHM